MDYAQTVKNGAAEFSAPFTEMFSGAIEFVPVLLGSFFVLVLGLIISPLVGRGVSSILELLKVDRGMDISGAKDALSSIGLNFKLSKITGEIVKYLVLVVFITIAADMLGLGQLSRLIDDFIRFIPQIVVALVMIGIGLTVADWLRDMVQSIAVASDNEDYSEILGNITRISIIVFAVMAALVQVGVATTLIQIMFAGVVFAFALAFGLGAKSTVERALEGWLNK